MTQFFAWMYVPVAQLKRAGVLLAQFIRWISRTYISEMPLPLSLWDLSSTLFEFLLSGNSCLAWSPTQLLSPKFPPTSSSLHLMGLVCCMLSRFTWVRLFATLWTIARQASLSMGFSRQEYQSGLPCPPPGDPPDFSYASCIGRQVLYH